MPLRDHGSPEGGDVTGKSSIPMEEIPRKKATGRRTTLRARGMRVESKNQHRSGITGELPEEQGASPQ
jgi:hypothetical protein